VEERLRTLTLTERDIPARSVIAVLSDIHIPHHDEAALRLAIECCEDAGVTHVFLNGDIADCGPASRHEGKRKKAMLDEGCLRESVAAGLWLYEWARTRPCVLVNGNHEGWVEKYIEQSPELKGTTTVELMGLWEHGDGIFASGSGGQNPGTRIRSLASDQTTSIGHLHRKFAAFWSSVDELGNTRTRGAYGNGHLSRPEAHEDYAGTYLNWQQSFEITRVYWVDGRPRFTTDQPEIHRDKRGRPVFEYRGKVYGYR
jgi:predicted phosphodiesterase